MPKLTDRVYIAKDGFPTREGWKLFFQTLGDIFISRSDIQGVRHILIDAEPGPPPELPKVWPYSQVGRCRKCGNRYNMNAQANDRPFREYQYISNIVKTSCPWCDHKWLEKCRDDSEPTFQYEWMGPKPQSKSPYINPIEWFMARFRGLAGDDGIIFINDTLEFPGIVMGFEWKFRQKRMYLKRTLTRDELDAMMDPGVNMEDTLDTFFLDLSKTMKYVEEQQNE